MLSEQRPLKISIVTATFNSADTLVECLDSVESQSYKNLEHIIVDGKSTDHTIALIEKRVHSIATFISEPDEGLYFALNKGISVATGDVIGFLHSDDIYADMDVLSQVAEAFDDHQICAVYGDLQYVQKINTNKVVRHWKSSPFRRWKLLFGWMPPHPTLFVRRQWLNAIDGFDTQYKISADYNSILSLFSKENFTAKYVPKLFIKMRIGGVSNQSLGNLIRKSKEDLHIARQYYFSGIFTVISKNIIKIEQFLTYRS